MSFKSRRNAQRIVGRKITKRDKGQRKEIGRLTRLLSGSQVQYADAEQSLATLQYTVNALATVLDTRAHRALSWLRRIVRIRSEIPADLLSSMKIRKASSVPPK